jgi:hypothetical protein
MIISITALAAAFAPLLTDAQAEVNGAFKPLVAAEYKKAKSLDVSDAFVRCHKVQEHANKLQEVAEQGLDHLTSVRDGHIDVRDFPEGFDATLETLAVAVTQFINLTRDMFETAEKSEAWAGNYALLKPLKKQMMGSLSLLRSSANQIAIEIRQAKTVVDNGKLLVDGTSDDDLKRLINKSHMMLGVDTPRWS